MSAPAAVAEVGVKRSRDEEGPEEDDVLGRGAEAVLRRVAFLGREAVVKERIKKDYRHPAVDESLTSKRLVQEVRSMARCRKLGIPTPAVYFVDTQKARIYMEYLDGAVTLKSHLSSSSADLDDACATTGRLIAKLHDGDIVHGDLTTSNIMRRPEGQLVLIDFGLSYTSSTEEDKAVDLYVLERAVNNAHSQISSEINARILAAYTEEGKCAPGVLKRLKQVQLRGRKRVMVG